MTDARTICAALGGRWSGSDGMVRCPCHEDRTPSLSISDGRDGKILVNCFSGCDPVDILRALNGQGLSEPSGDSPAPRLHHVTKNDRWNRKPAATNAATTADSVIQRNIVSRLN